MDEDGRKPIDLSQETMRVLKFLETFAQTSSKPQANKDKGDNDDEGAQQVADVSKLHAKLYVGRHTPLLKQAR